MSFKHIYIYKFIFIFCVVVGFASNALALQIKLVQQGQVVLEASALSAEMTLVEPVEPEKSLLITHVAAKTFSAREAAFNVAVYFLDRRTVRITRQKSGAELEVSITIAEFKSGVKVTRGVTQFAKDIYQKRVVIPRLQNKSSIVTTMATSIEFDQENGAHLFFSSYFPDSNTLSIMRSEGAEIKTEGDSIDSSKEDSSVPQEIKPKKDVLRYPVPEATVHWQIVEFFDGVKVTHGTAKISHFSKDTNAYLVEPIQDRERAFILYDWQAGHSTHGKKALSTVQASIADNGVLFFSRPDNGKKRSEGLDIQWKLVELESAASRVQSGVVKFHANESEVTVMTKPIAPQRSIVLLNASGGDVSGIIPQAQQWAGLKFVAEVTSPETLRIRRGKGSIADMSAEVSWSVVEFAPISLTQPRGGEIWYVGERQKISWEYTLDEFAIKRGKKTVPHIDIQLSMKQGADDFPFTVATSIPVTEGGYNWLIPEEFHNKNVIGKDVMVKVSMREANESHFDISKKPFEIKGVLKLLAPQGGETWYVGDESHKIEWRYRGIIGDLSLFYDQESGYGADPFPLRQRIARLSPGENGIGSYNWTSIPNISSTRIRVRIVSDADKDVASLSGKDFTIIPRVEIYSPSKNADPFDAEKIQVIKWKYSGTIPFFNLYYRTSETSDWILTAKDLPGGEAGARSYRWFVPAEAVCETLQIKIEKAEDSKVFDRAPDDGNGFFSAQSWVTWTQPSSKVPETWRIGELRQLRWNTGGLSRYFNFEYSVDAGEKWIKEAVVRASDQLYQWIIPDTVSDRVKIRLSDVKNPETFCESERTIRIISRDDFSNTSQPQNKAWWVKSESRKKTNES